MYYVSVYMYTYTHIQRYMHTHTREAFMHVNTHMCTHIHPFHLKAKLNPFASCWLFDHNNEENDVEDGHLEWLHCHGRLDCGSWVFGIGLQEECGKFRNNGKRARGMLNADLSGPSWWDSRRPEC